MQVVEFARMERALRAGWRIDAAAGPFDIVATCRDIRWAVTVLEDGASVDVLAREVQRHGVAIDVDRSTPIDSALQIARSLHVGRFSHFSVVAPGTRRDHSLHHGFDCIVLDVDVVPC